MNQASVGFHCPECVKGSAQPVFRGPPQPLDPIATKVLIGVNLLVFVWAVAESGSVTSIGIEALRRGGLFATGLDPSGAGLIGVTEGEWYRLVSSGFLHSGLMHLAFNMYALWILGPQLERALGRPRFVALYFVSMLGGAAGVMLLDPDVATVGASGAIFGLFGAVAVIQKSLGGSIWRTGIGQLLVLNLLITFAVGSISVGGHLGGLVAGTAVSAVFVATARVRQAMWVGLGVAALFGVGLVAAAVWLASNPVV